MNSRPIRFFHRGRIVEIAEAPPTRTVLDWLREDARCTGTKEGCNEGDCGACTVVVGEPAAAGDAGAVRGLKLATVNACLRFLPTLDGQALFTVEDLTSIAGGALHPVQAAMVACHGSQCGFCTPGFVMSMWSAYERHVAHGTVPTRRQLADELAGNLCRCTGYRPILDAAERMFDAEPVALDTAPSLAALRPLPAKALSCTTPAGRYDAPTTLDDLAALCLARPEARLLAGGTDVAIWVNKQFRPLPDLIHTGRIAELRRIELDAETRTLTIGAAATLEDAWHALVGLHPALAEVAVRFASPPIRHAGTLGGNVANGSPIGDGPPVLMALGAELVLRRGDERRRLPIDAFYLGYMRNALQPGEFLERIVVPGPVAGLQVRADKLSKRYDSDISAVCGAYAIALDDAGTVAAARLAYGGMAATVQRARHAEAAMLGRPWTEATALAAAQALARDFQPWSDVRGSAAYRLQAAGNLLRRLWQQTRPNAPATPAETTVWHGLRHG